MNTKSLLIEFLTEELPPINLEKNIGNAFMQNICLEIKSFLPEDIKASVIITPRRFGCVINDVSIFEPDAYLLRKGPAINSSLKDSLPLPALLGFMRSCNVDNWQDLEQKDGYFYAKQINKGRNLQDVLGFAISNSLKKIQIAKNMRWGNNEYYFVRPVHNLLILHGDEIIDLTTPILGLIPSHYTFGHRIMSFGEIHIKHPESYFSQLELSGKVIADFSIRKDLINNNLRKIANEIGLVLNDMDGLLDEVTALVEFPVVLQGSFDENFLDVPQECLILSMAKNQKYFALLDPQGKLSNKFLFVANIDSLEPNTIINGNERVLSARLADAKFFYDVDKKHGLDYYKEKLGYVVYHNKLGSQLNRVERIKRIALGIVHTYYPALLEQDIKDTVNFMKADLATEMVGEFPELQGVMGKYYALHGGYKIEVANAIEKHYYPRFSGDDLPNDDLSTVVALAEKLETLVGIWGIGLVPTGDKDPFALRRAALGVVRILLKNNLDIKKLLSVTTAEFMGSGENWKSGINDEVYQFILQRLFNYLTSNNEFSYSKHCVQGVCAAIPGEFYYLPVLLDTLERFAINPNNQLLFAANKRIDNILKKNIINASAAKNARTVNQHLFKNPVENRLFDLLGSSSDGNFYDNWDKYFSVLEEFNQPIANFFDSVMVMDDDLAVRNNRLCLLIAVYDEMNVYCKLSELCL